MKTIRSLFVGLFVCLLLWDKKWRVRKQIRECKEWGYVQLFGFKSSDERLLTTASLSSIVVWLFDNVLLSLAEGDDASKQKRDVKNSYYKQKHTASQNARLQQRQFSTEKTRIGSGIRPAWEDELRRSISFLWYLLPLAVSQRHRCNFESLSAWNYLLYISTTVYESGNRWQWTAGDTIVLSYVLSASSANQHLPWRHAYRMHMKQLRFQ